MDNFDKLLKDLNFEFFGTGQHKISVKKFIEFLSEDKIFALDVRSKEEAQYISFNFAHNIPTHELPDRISEIPKDKLIVVFCSSVTRAAIVYAYLKINNFEDVKILTAGIDEIASLFKPGNIMKVYKGAK